VTISRLWFAIIIALIAITTTPVIAAELVHVRLKDRLDRPRDGYCLDILGTGANLRLGLPLFAHNCKGGATPDSTVIYTSKGQLVFPGAEVCVTAFGVNNTVLPGTAVLLRPCDYQIAFFNTSNLQKFEYLKNGQLRLSGYDLCLAVGNESSSTYSSSDRWRVLSMASCASTSLSHSAWEMVPLQ
jgi:hypothetical protein